MDAASWVRLKDVVAEALKRSHSERASYVRARITDPDESAMIMSMLAAHDERATTIPSTAARRPAPDESSVKAGAHVGPYLVVERLGSGGMGEVFLGRDLRLRRRVALKCLLASIPRDLRRDRILHEARAVAAINHPNVASIYDVVERDDRMFIVMEYVEGETLAARLKREPLSVDGMLRIARQLASALTAAHSEGVVHRDLKPANVQITAQETVKVLDFGIANAARSLTSVDHHSTTHPADAVVGPSQAPQPGTPPYMSPEQLFDRVVDERSDIFSLGVVLFEMATGRRPFAGTDALNVALSQSDGAPRADRVDPRVPSPVAAIIAKALALDVADRYQTAESLAAELDAVALALTPAPRSTADVVKTVAVRLAFGLPIALMILGVVGLIATTGFNTTFGRDASNARFGSEPVLAYFRWGALAMFPSLVMMTLAAGIVIAIRGAFALLKVFAPIARWHERARTSIARGLAKAGLNRPATLAEALLFACVATLAGLLALHFELVNAWTGLFNTSPIERLWPMRESVRERLYYHVQFDVATLAFSFGLFKVLQLRQVQQSREGTVPIAMLCALIAVLVLLNEWPYRTFSHRDFERVDLAGSRCYITGQSGDEFLVLCPANAPPRNRVVKRTDPALHRTGIIENVYRGIEGVPASE